MLFGDYRCFFFQAEDGIRYLTVTGVQTCALPIYKSSGPRSLEFKSGGARRLRERLHAPMVFIAGAVEGNLLDAVFLRLDGEDRKSTRLNSSHSQISYAVFCLKKKNAAFIGPVRRI